LDLGSYTPVGFEVDRIVLPAIRKKAWGKKVYRNCKS
jgi:hypothetical protein